MLDICASSQANKSSARRSDKDKPLPITTGNGKDRLSSAYVPLTEKIQKYSKAAHEVPFFSVEFFPPRTNVAASNLIQLLDRFRDGGPYFCDITWHAAGNPGLEKPTSSITIAGVALNYCCLDTMLHVTCIGLTKVDLREHLERAKSLGIRNILALRGDKHENCTIFDFEYAADLVRFIRQEYGDYFTIVVAGYPVPHPESKDKEHDLHCLKMKVDAGADLIITQLFFEVDDFIEFVGNCRALGITVPILPGICSINSYASMHRFASLSAVPIPERVLQVLEPIKTNDAAVRNYGVHFLVDMCRKLIGSNLSPGLHFYTLNQDTIIRVLKELGLWKKMEIRVLPWKVATNHRRVGESTRSVFWINRPKTYLHRTFHWDEHPRAIWSAKYSSQISHSLEGYYGFLERTNPKEELNYFLGEQPTPANLYKLFYSYFLKYSSNFDANDGTAQAVKSISVLPWFQEANSHFLELAFLHYGQYIMSGILITNYLPRFNGISSNDRRHGWGEEKGTLYQKEYIEFFIDPCYLERLQSILQESSSLNYLISNQSGTIQMTNWPQHPLTISWGRFPSYQLIPAYAADLKSFDVWRGETFGLFGAWLNHYQPGSGPYELIRRTQEDYLLVSVIANQFVSAEAGFKQIFNQLLALDVSCSVA